LDKLGSRRSGARTTLLVSAAVLVAALGAGQAVAARAKPKPRQPQSPAFYTLANKNAKCRAHYSRETVTLRERRHRHSVVVHQVRCVYTGAGSSLGASFSFPTDLPTAAVSVTVIPGAVADSYTIPAGQTLDVGGAGVLANDDGSGLSAALVSGPAHGVLALNRNGSFRYTPAAGFSGVEHFSYKDTDASGEGSLPATVTIDVTPMLGQVDAYEVSAGSTLNVGAPGAMSAAVGSGLQASLVSGVSDGSLTLNADGSFSYTPAPGFSGDDSFTVSAVDGAAQDAGTETVTVIVDPASSPPVVPQAPSVIAQDFYGAVGNTELQVGGTRGAGPEVYRPGASALAGDSDPGGGSLSTTPGTIATAHGGSVTLAANGTFTYQPAVGFSGTSDSFTYQVDASEGTSAATSATIHFSGTRVWYVNNAAAAGGDGSSAAPFDSLATVSGHALSGDDIFVFDGSGPYAGGVVLGANQTLVGQSVGLTVGSDTVVPAAGGANPVIHSSSGADVTLGDNDTVTGVTVTNTGGVGISASGLSTFTVGPTVNVTSTGGVGISATGVNAFTVGSSVTIANTGGDGLDVSGGSGTASVAGPITVHASGGVSGNSVAIEGRTSGMLTLSGPITDDGSGVLLTNDGVATINFSGPIVASTGTHPAFTATGGGTVSTTSSASTLATTTATALDVERGSLIGSGGLVFQSISAGTGSPGAPNPVDGVVISGTGTTGGGLTVTGLGTTGSGGTIQDATGTGASDGGVSVSDSGPLTLSNMTFIADAGAGVYVATVPVFSVAGSSISGGGAGIRASGDAAGTTDGYLDSNTIGDTTANSGASVGDGIDLSSVVGGTLDVELSGNTVQQIAQGIGIFAQTLGTGTLDLTLAGNTVTMGSVSSLNGVAITSGSGGDGTVCLNPSLNIVSAAGSGANGMEVEQLSAGSVFAIQGFPGGDTAAVASYLGSPTDTLAFGSGGAAAVATTTGPPFTTPLAPCAAPPTQHTST
jgi:hypothetical protein